MKYYKFFSLIVLLVVFSSFVSAETYVANSKDWSDVYSVMLLASFDDKIGTFTNTESLGMITRTINPEIPVVVYESKVPYVPHLESQMKTTGFNVKDSVISNDFSLDLDPETGKYILVSKDNFRISISLAPLAKKTNAWVLIVTPENSAEIAKRIKGANDVLAVGDFRRDVLEKIQPYFKEWINNNNVYKDSQDIAKKLGGLDNIIIGDGNFLESEFFSTSNPVLLSGKNKILDETFNFLIDEKVKSIVIVGNELGVVGETIRSKSEKSIAVFVKFGQSDIKNSGQVYSLSYYSLPKPEIELTIKDVVYDSVKKELIAYFENTGNSGMYFLNTLTVNNGEEELSSVSDESVQFLGEGEILPITYSVNIPTQRISNETVVQFYTSFGLTPTELDTFLTMEDKYGPPFSLQLKLGELKDDSSNISISDITYFKQYKRLGITIVNNEETSAYYAIKIPQLLVNGIETDLFKEDSVAGMSTKTTYIPVVLDDIDLQENTPVTVNVQYGSTEGLLIKPLSEKLELGVKSGSLILIVIIVTVLLVLLVIVFLLIRKR